MWILSSPDAASALDSPGVRKALRRYVDVVQGRRRPKYSILKTIPASFETDDSTSDLWALHDALLEEYPMLEAEEDLGERRSPLDSAKSFLDLKIELGRRIVGRCHLCERRCGADRHTGAQGWCRLGSDFHLSTAFLHMGEEPELVPSGTIFTVGCNLRCLHCQNWTISQRIEPGAKVSPLQMAKVVEQLGRQGCRNINMVGGDPTPWLYNWLETFRYVKVETPTVWNTNTYYSVESAKLLAGFADIYLLDFKYGNDACAARLSSAPGYVEACQRNHLTAQKYGELIIRVLVLPEHLECCCRAILNWIGKNLGPETRVNMMWQYRPEWRAWEVPELRRRLNDAERKLSLEIAREACLRNYIT